MELNLSMPNLAVIMETVGWKASICRAYLAPSEEEGRVFKSPLRNIDTADDSDPSIPCDDSGRPGIDLTSTLPLVGSLTGDGRIPTSSKTDSRLVYRIGKEISHWEKPG